MSARLPAFCARCPVVDTGFFAALSCAAKRLVACLMSYRRCRARLILFQEGDETGRLYALKSGLVKLVKARPDGREQIIRLVRPGELFNLESLGDGISPVTAEVIVDAEICHMDAARLLERMSRSAELTAEIVRLLASALVESERRILELGAFSARRRLAAFLLDLPPSGTPGPCGPAPRTAGSGRGRPPSGSREVLLPLSRGEIGEMIGASLETVSRLTQGLRRQGLLALEGRRVRLLDLPRLRAAAGRAREGDLTDIKGTLARRASPPAARAG